MLLSPKRTAVTNKGMTMFPPPFQVVLAILSIQVGAAIAVKLFPALGPLGTVFGRVALAALILWIFVRPELDQAVIGQGIVLLVYGGTIAAMNVCFYLALERIPLGIAATIEFLGPLGVAVAMSRRALDFVWASMAITGLAVIIPDIGHDLDPVGVLFAVAAAICWAAFILLTKRIGRNISGSGGLVLGMSIAALLLLPLGIGRLTPMLSDLSLLPSMLGIAVLSTALPFYLEFQALKQLPARVFGVLITLEPVAATLVGAILLNEMIDVQVALAVICVTFAAIGATACRKR